MKTIFARDRSSNDKKFLNLKGLRIYYNWKATTVAETLGISRQWLYKLEYGIAVPKQALKESIELLFEKSWEELSKEYTGGEINARRCPTCKGTGEVQSER